MQTIKCKNNFGEEIEVSKDKFYFRPSVYGVAIRGNEILVMDSKSTGKLWLPGGGVELGEKMFDALAREFQEETGLKIKAIGELLLGKENFYYHQPSDEAMHAFVFFYLCEVESGNISEAGMEELEDARNVRWLTLDEVEQIGFTNLNEELLRLIKKTIIE